MSRYLPPILNPNAGGGPPPPPEVTDHFAPTIIVGNVLSGDPAVAQVAPFRYIPDPGDGTGIELALTEAAALPGSWVHVRRGTYTLAAAVLPLAITTRTRVTGDGAATILVQRTDDRRVFTMAGIGAELSQMGFTLTVAAAGATGEAVVDALGGVGNNNAVVSGLYFLKATSVISADESLFAVIRAAGTGTMVGQNRMSGVDANPQSVTPVAGIRVAGSFVQVFDNRVSGGDVQIVVQDDGASSLIRGNQTLGAIDGGFFGAVGIDLQGLVNVCVGNHVALVDIGIRSIAPLNNISSNNVISTVTSAITLSAASDSNICVGNMIGGDAVTDLGTDNEVAHNV